MAKGKGGWAIYYGRHIWINSARRLRREAVEAWCLDTDMSWELWQRDGYRVIRVTITPDERGPAAKGEKDE